MLAATFTQADDAIVLIESGRVTGEVDPKDLEALLASLEERNFLHSALRFRGSLHDALKRSVQGTALGYRLAHQTDADRCSGRDAALVTCDNAAHLALVITIERQRRFAAECIGRVVQRSSFSGRAGQSRYTAV